MVFHGRMGAGQLAIQIGVGMTEREFMVRLRSLVASLHTAKARTAKLMNAASSETVDLYYFEVLDGISDRIEGAWFQSRAMLTTLKNGYVPFRKGTE